MNHRHDDDGARPAQRYSGTASAHRVTFGPFPLLAGSGVTHLLLAIVFAASSGTGSAWHAFTLTVITVILGLPLAIVGCVLALILGLLLRPIGNQALHIGAFFGVFALLSILIVFLAGGGGMGTLATGAAIGTAAAVGRASVWRLVTVHPEESTTRRHLAA